MSRTAGAVEMKVAPEHLPLGAGEVLVLCALGPRFEAVARECGFVLRPDGLVALSDDDLRGVRALVMRSGVVVDQALLDRLPALRHIIRAGSGVDNINQAELASRSIGLTLRKAASADALAEVALAGLLSLTRRVARGSWDLRLGRWSKSQLVGDCLAELEVVVWGAGPVGRACEERLRPLVRATSFIAWPSARDVSTVSREEALERADVHVLSLPLRPETRGLFGADLLRQSATARPYLVNVGRLDLMDRDEVIEALRDSRLRGVYVDAIDAEHVPWAAEVLRGEPLDLLISPHLGAQRDDVLDGLGEWVLDELARTFDGR